MRRLFKVIFTGILLLPIMVAGQNYINSPYTYHGIGDLLNTGFGYNRSMGGSSIALRPRNQINYLNPASYTSQDTLSFLFQSGLTSRFANYTSDEGNEQSRSFNPDYLALGFPITRWWKFSAGLTPFSRINYWYSDFNEEIAAPNVILFEQKGNGGFNEFYFGSAFNVYKDISLGINASYIFGKLSRTREVAIEGVNAEFNISEDFNAKDFYFRLGLQYYPTFEDKSGNKHNVLFGLVYDFATDIKTDAISQTSRNFIIMENSYGEIINQVADTFAFSDTTINITLPQKIGFGVSYGLNDKLLVTGEYSVQSFKDGLGISKSNNLTDYSSVRFGVEYVPVPFSDRNRAKYFQRMHYRLGGHYTNTYVSIEDTQIKDYGVSVGLGFPWRNPQKLYTFTTFNISYEYGIRGTTENNLLKEDYHIVTLSFTLHDFWFHKPKYD